LLRGIAQVERHDCKLTQWPAGHCKRGFLSTFGFERYLPKGVS